MDVIDTLCCPDLLPRGASILTAVLQVIIPALDHGGFIGPDAAFSLLWYHDGFTDHTWMQDLLHDTRSAGQRIQLLCFL